MNANQQHTDPDALPSGLSQPAVRGLQAAGYTRLSQLAQVTEAELLKLHGVGPKAIRTLGEALAAAGMSFAKSGKA